MNNKKKVVLIILMLISTIILGVFNLTPLSIVISYLSVSFSTIGHFIFLLYHKKIPKTIKTWYYIGLLLMIVSICTCYIHYEQSFVSGFVANISFYNIGNIILFYYLFLKYKISFPKLFTVLYVVGSISIITIAIMAITNFTFINVSELTGKIVEFNSGKVSKDLINFIAIFWFSKFLFQNKYKYLVYSILFFAGNHFYEIQRFALLTTLLVVGVGIALNKNLQSNLKFIVPAFFTIMVISIFIFNTTEGSALIDRFYEASKILSGDLNKINDDSTAARIFETDFALERFNLHPLLGNGLYRASEADKVIGSEFHFYPNDIGFFGILYVSGILGAVILLKQILFVLRQLKLRADNYYNLGALLCLIFVLFNTIITGESILNYQIFFFYFCLLKLSNVSIIKLKNTQWKSLEQ